MTSDETQTGMSDLPPPGDEQRDAMKRRLDKLQEQAEELSNVLETERTDPKNWRIQHDESIRAQDPDLAIRHPLATHRYSWVYRDPYNKFGGRTVHSYEARGWEVVTSSMPDAKGMRHSPEGYVVNADCLLMRQRIDVHLIEEQKDRDRRISIQRGVSANLQEVADRRGVNVYTEGLPDHVQSAIASSSASNMAARRSQRARSIMNSPALARDIRTGTIPGMPAPGQRS